MSSMEKTDTVRSSGRVSAEDKASQTTTAAQAIIDAEASAREQKTARLRAMRLEREAAQSSAEKHSPSRKARKPAHRT